MDFSKSTPRRALTIQGIELQIPQPFSEGYVCDAEAASVLNQVLAENARNNKASSVQKAKEEAEKSGVPIELKSLQASLDEYVAGYSFGIRRGGSTGPRDPVEKEAREIAGRMVKDALKKKGYSINKVSAEDMNRFIDGTLEKRPEIREQAKAIVDQRAQIGVEELDLDVGKAA